MSQLPELDSSHLQALIQGSYESNNMTDKTIQGTGYSLDRDLSNRQHKVYIDAQGNPNVTYTGSRTAGDWLFTDVPLAVGLGKYTHRYKSSQRLLGKVRDKYQGRPVTTMGHSLGGYLAESVGGDKVVTVNKGAGIDALVKRRRKNQTDIRTSTDPVSALSAFQRGGRKITIKTKLNPVKAHSYTNLTKYKGKI